VPIEEFWRAIRLDLFGTFLGCRFGIPAIIASGGGSVINMASNVALMGVAGRDCYTAAKGGIAAITRSMAVEFAPQRVFDWLVVGQVVAINPAHAVRAPKHIVRRGKTPVLIEEQARRLLESIKTVRKTKLPDGTEVEKPWVVGCAIGR
jgi:NAD(P)-dependent dehydrogenase (short-subunit alcohol dehydrogenase family)